MTRVWAAVGALALLAPGCDAPSMMPGPPPDTVGELPGASVPRANQIEMILPGSDSPGDRARERIGRLEAGRLRALFRAERPGPGAHPSAQADLVRAAIGRGAEALVVVPGAEPAALTVVLAEAHARGLGVAILGEPAPGLEGKATRVEPEPFVGVAGQLASAAAEDARAEKLAVDGPGRILIVARSKPDRVVAARVEALRAGAAVAKLGPPELAEYEGDASAARAAVAVKMAAFPELAVVLTADDEASLGASQARRAETPPARFRLAGFLSFESNDNLVRSSEFAALADPDLGGLTRRAVAVALGRAGGRAGPDLDAREIPFRRFPPRVEGAVEPVRSAPLDAIPALND